MKKLFKPQRIILITLVILTLGMCGYCGFGLYKFRQQKSRLLDSPSEEIFQSRFMNGEPIPPEVTEIYAAEIHTFGGWEALARFKATDQFITKTIETNYGSEGIYSEWPCHDAFSDPNFIAEFSTELGWWQPFRVTSKTCYHAYTCIVHDEKFLLFDLDNDIIYFYRQNCGLCPSGEPEMAPLKPWCQQYWDDYSP